MSVESLIPAWSLNPSIGLCPRLARSMRANSVNVPPYSAGLDFTMIWLFFM